MFHCCRTTCLASFPDYLFVQLKKFTIGDDWVPKKLGERHVAWFMERPLQVTFSVGRPLKVTLTVGWSLVMGWLSW